MTHRSIVSLIAIAALTTSTLAHAEDVSCVTGRFEEASVITAAHKATYTVEISNPGAATQVTLVWKLDGHEVQRQSLDVGHGARWRTWGSRPTGTAHTVEVQVLDAGGTSLKEDKIELP